MAVRVITLEAKKASISAASGLHGNCQMFTGGIGQHVCAKDMPEFVVAPSTRGKTASLWIAQTLQMHIFNSDIREVSRQASL